jgi:hypothetical protein
MNFGGKEKMRKESIGRLLLTLVTAFVMVAGGFSAAVQTWSDLGQTGDQVNQPSEMAVSDFGIWWKRSL